MASHFMKYDSIAEKVNVYTDFPEFYIIPVRIWAAAKCTCGQFFQLVYSYVFFSMKKMPNSQIMTNLQSKLTILVKSMAR